jgi:hypothetical protein
MPCAEATPPYDPGAGLAAATATVPTAPSTQWTIELAGALGTAGRLEVADGDYVRLRSRWHPPDDECGYLLAETDPRDPAQRVSAFGRARQKGTIWRLSRAPHRS